PRRRRRPSRAGGAGRRPEHCWRSAPLTGGGDSDGEQPRWRQQQPAAEPGPDVPARAAARGGARGRPRPRRPTAGQAPRPSPDRGKSPRELSERVGGRASLRGRPRARSMPAVHLHRPRPGLILGHFSADAPSPGSSRRA
ncbi:unnamed protein product, partial [Prorocentrum cordatum]